MRLASLFFLLVNAAFAALAPTLEVAFKNFRPDPPRGWSYTQTTAAEGQSTVERYDATKAEFDRWSLVQKNGRAPTAAEAQDYAEMRSRRSRGGNAPKITDQIDRASIALFAETPDRLTYRCRLLPGDRGDVTARFLRVTLVVVKAAAEIESIELASTAEFSPTFAVKIAEMKTTLTYLPTAGDTPVLPLLVATHVRGRAFLFKSLDADMTVTFSDYAPTAKK